MGEVNTQVGKRIRALRMGHELTLDKLAELAKISSKHLGKIERGTANPSIQCITDIATALRLPVRSILEADHEQSRETLINEVLALVPELSDKDVKIVYRLVAMLANR